MRVAMRGAACLLTLLASAAGSAQPRSALQSAVAAPQVDTGAQRAVASPFGLLDRVQAPGLPGMPLQAAGEEAAGLYSGYVAVSSTRQLFYALQLSSGDPSTDPLVLWLNGGPGCSSIGGGFFSELGPFFPNAEGKLDVNPWAWSRYANVVFLDSPAYVGFSFSNSSADKVVGDARTASDSRAFLLGFLAKFPGLAAAPLYISGESYAGHYVPTLAAAILEGNAAAAAPTSAEGFLNLKGVLIGNAWTDAPTDNFGATEHWFNHYMISRATFDTMTRTCNFSNVGPIKAAGAAHARLKDGANARKSADPLDECDIACERAMGEMGPLNIYQLFADVCAAGLAHSSGAQLARKLAGVATPPSASAATPSKSVEGSGSMAARWLARAREVIAYWAGIEATRGAAASPASSDGAGAGFPAESPCIDDFVTSYLNRKDVREALHVRPDAGVWSVCTDEINYSTEDLLSSMLPLYPRLIAAGLRVWIFSGDVDGIVPTSGSRAWVEGLQLRETEHWRPWLVPDGAFGPQVGGYVVGYDGLTFATVRGAGHMVPYTQPARAAHLFKAFVNDAPL